MDGACWRDAFRRLSLAYGWTPDEIAGLTPAQLCAYLDRSGPRKGLRMMNPAAARAYRAAKRAESEVENRPPRKE